MYENPKNERQRKKILETIDLEITETSAQKATLEQNVALLIETARKLQGARHQLEIVHNRLNGLRVEYERIKSYRIPSILDTEGKETPSPLIRDVTTTAETFSAIPQEVVEPLPFKAEEEPVKRTVEVDIDKIPPNQRRKFLDWLDELG